MATSGLDKCVRIDISINSESGSAAMNKLFGRLQVALAEKKSEESVNRKPLIRKIPFMRRDTETFRKYYEPRVVTIGPLHHDEIKFKLSAKVKVKLAALFIEENGLQKEVLYNKIKGQIEELKKCYNDEDIDEKYKKDEDELVSIFFVDGCAVLHYIQCSADVDDKKLKDLRIKSDQEAFINQDLFLIENQLPYQLLETIISCFTEDEKKEKMKSSICNFIDRIVRHTRGVDIKEETDSTPKQPAHLLELFRERLLRPVGKEGENHQKTERTKSSSAKRRAEKVWFSYRNVNELKAAGIKLISETKGYLQDITFTPGIFYGTLKLPSLIVDDSTAPKFMNLIAYEMSPDFHNNYEVSSYVSFLDTLIDETNDVKELRQSQVLRNLLGSDEEVAKIFNEIGTDLVPDPSTHEQVRSDIQEHYDKKWRTWIAQGYYTHFSSPWTGIALFAAMLALGLALVQTASGIISAIKDFQDLNQTTN